MRSWKFQMSLGIREAAAAVAEKYGQVVDKNQGLPPTEFGLFIAAANMQVEPMINLTISRWVDLLRAKGLIWVGTLIGVHWSWAVGNVQRPLGRQMLSDVS